MKKLIIVLCLILTACALPKKEEKFVNPIFYKPMEGLSHKPDLYIIRPNKLFTQNFYGYNTTVNCEMLENTMDTVVLKCLHTPEPQGALQVVGTNGEPTIWTYKFYIWPPEDQTSEIGTYVRVYRYLEDEYDRSLKNEEVWASYSALIITFSPKDHMEIWGNAINTFKEDKSVDDARSN